MQSISSVDTDNALSETESSDNETDSIESKRFSSAKILILELIQTERSYVLKLNTAVKVIIQLAMEASIFDEETAGEQFSDFIAITTLHSNMLETMEENEKEVINILKQHVPAMKIYKSYLQHFEERREVRIKLMKIKKIRDFLNHVSQHLDHTLESYLIEPVQRIPRYKLLLEQVIPMACMHCYFTILLTATFCP